MTGNRIIVVGYFLVNALLQKVEQQGKVAIEKRKFLWTTNIFTWRREEKRSEDAMR
jgi:hypothetical protein